MIDASRLEWHYNGGRKSTVLSGSDFVGLPINSSIIKINYDWAKSFVGNFLLYGYSSPTTGKGRFIDTLDVTETMTEAKLLARTTWATWQTYTLSCQINPWLQLKEMLELLITVCWNVYKNNPDQLRSYTGGISSNEYPATASWTNVLNSSSGDNENDNPAISWEWYWNAVFFIPPTPLMAVTVGKIGDPLNTINTSHIQGTLIQSHLRTYKRNTGAALTSTMSFTLGGVTISLSALDVGTYEENITETWPATYSASAVLFSSLTSAPSLPPFAYSSYGSNGEARMWLVLDEFSYGVSLAGTRVITDVEGELDYT